MCFITSDTTSTFLVVEIDTKYYTRFFPDLEEIYFTCTVDPNNLLYEEYLKYLRFLLSKIYFLYNEKNVSEMELESTVKKLISFLIEYFYSYIFEPAEGDDYKIILNTGERKPYDPSRIYRIIDYIYDHFSEAIKLDDIAEMEFLSKCYTSKFIKKFCGLSFSELLSLARCERAEELLITTSKTIDTISEEVGFSNRYHLNINFKRWFKVPPSDYKRRYRERNMEVKKIDSSVDLEKALPTLKSYLEYI